MRCLLVPPADQCAVCSALGEKAGRWVGVEAGTTSHQPLVGGQQGCNVTTGTCAYLGSRAAEGLGLAAPGVPGDKPNFGDIGYGCLGTRGLSGWGRAGWWKPAGGCLEAVTGSGPRDQWLVGFLDSAASPYPGPEHQLAAGGTRGRSSPIQVPRPEAFLCLSAWPLDSRRCSGVPSFTGKLVHEAQGLAGTTGTQPSPLSCLA